MTSKITTAVVGCGYWGNNLIRNFAQLGSLKYLCDSNVEQANRIAESYNVEAKTFQDILRTAVDAVVIATPSGAHYQLAKSTLNAGKHVFVEKPLALSFEQGKELVDLSQQQSKVLMTGHLLQYHPAYLKLKQLVFEGELGKIRYIHSSRLNLGKFTNEENVLWSLAPHDFSMILGLVNDMPETVLATGSAYLNSKIHDTTTAVLTFSGGLQASVFTSWLHPFKEHKLVVVGDKNMAVFDDVLDWSSKLKLYPHQVEWVGEFPQPKPAEAQAIELEVKEPLKSECMHFLDCIKDSKVPISGGLEVLNVLNVLEASQNSLTTGAKIQIR